MDIYSDATDDDEEYSYSSSESSLETNPWGISSSLLSHPSNQISSSSGEEETRLSVCVDETTQLTDEADSGTESDEQDKEVDIYSNMDKVIPTTNKVVPLASLKKQPEMGILITPLNSKLTPLSTLSATELDEVILQQEARQSQLSQPVKMAATVIEQNNTVYAALESHDNRFFLPTSTPTKLTLLSTLSAQELEEVRLNQQKSLSTKKVSTTSLTPLSTLSAHELEEVRLNVEKRLSTMRPIASKPVLSHKLTLLSSLADHELDQVFANQSTLTKSRLTPLASLTPEQFNTVSLNSEKKQQPAAYKLEKIVDLSAHQKDQLFIAQRKHLLKNIKPIAELSSSELSALHANSTPLECPYHDKLHVKPVNDLTVAELRELVAECRATHTNGDEEEEEASLMIKTIGPDTRKSLPTQSMVGKRNRLHVTDAKPDILLKSVSTQQQQHNPLVDFNTLPLAKQTQILETIALRNKTKTFTNNKSSLTAKKEFDVKFGSSVLTSANIQNLYHGLSTNIAACPLKTTTNDTDLMDLFTHQYPSYADLLKKNVEPEMLDSLMNSKDRNFFFVIPSDALLALYRQQGELLRIAKLATAYLIVLLKRGETIPVDNKCYSCANLLDDNRVMVRRIDNETLSIDNVMTAKLDPASGGRVYKMLDNGTTTVTSEEARAREALVTEIVDEIEIRQEAKEELLAEEEAELEEEEEEFIEEQVGDLSTTTTTTRRTREPQVIVILPEGSADSLSIVPIKEVTPLRSKLVQLAGVYRNSLYKNRKLETLATKMLNADYSGAKHMTNYIDHAAQPEISQLMLKTFAYDNLYNKYLSTSVAMTGAERLNAVENYAISSSGDNNLNYALDNTTNLKEFVIDTKTMKISKAQLINHFNVLCFKTKKDGEYATTAFSLPDETSSATDTYMSSDESLFLKFKDNLLHSLVLNTNISSFALTQLAEPERMTSFVTGKPFSVMDQISVQVPMAEKAVDLYAKDLNFTQFLGLVLPLSQPSFFERVKIALAQHQNKTSATSLRRVVGTELATLDKKLESYKKVKEGRTTNINMGIARGVLEAATGYQGYSYHAEHYAVPETNELMVRYEFDPELNTGRGQLSFNALINYEKPQDLPTLIVELPHPAERKRQVFRFQLPVARKPPQTEEAFYEARTRGRDGLHFIFHLVNSKLQHIYIRYRQSRRAQELKSDVTKDLTKFLAIEAYAYKRYNLNIVPSYMTQRLNKFVTLSAIPRDKLDLQLHSEFFTSLQKEIEQYMEKEGLTPLLVYAPDTKITTEKNALIEKSGYKTPKLEETQLFQSMMLSNFAQPPTLVTASAVNTRATTVLNGVIQEYTILSGSKNLKEVDFALFMYRFKHISNYLSFVFNAKK